MPRSAMPVRTLVGILCLTLVAGCTAQEVEIDGLDEQASFYCEGSLSTNTLWISGRSFVFAPDSSRDYVFGLNQNAAVVRVVGDTLRVFTSHPVSVPDNSSVPMFVDPIIVKPYELLEPDSLAPAMNRTSIRC